MIVGVREHKKVNLELATEAGFDCIEYEDQLVKLASLEHNLSEAIDNARRKSYPYIVITTIGKGTVAELKSVIKENASLIADAGIPIYIENGMDGDDVCGYISNEFSDTKAISELASWANKLFCSDNSCKDLFGVCVNAGYVLLLAKSIRLSLEGAGDYLKLVHVNENDGFRNTYQMPYTFTKGRGDLTTDYHRFIGTLSRMNYDERMIFDVVGLFNRTPQMLIPNMLELQANVAMFWLHIIDYAGMLDCGRKIILFGAGRMASNFMLIWGDRFRPAFIVDNDKKKWGTLHRGVEVKAPEAILEVPEEERLVILCNMRYEEIGMQLDKMGVAYTEYDDNYYDFVVQ